MPYRFLDLADELEFVLVERARPRSKGISSATLINYALSRNAFYRSYRANQNLSADIKSHPLVYNDLEPNPDRLYHYCVKVSLDMQKRWQAPDSRILCYLARERVTHKHYGAIFFEKMSDPAHPHVYIWQLSVAQSNRHIGRRLMQCVLQHYPAHTRFEILTRNFNDQAIALYRDRFNFLALADQGLAQHGLSSKLYCGFVSFSTDSIIEQIKKNMTETNEGLNNKPAKP